MYWPGIETSIYSTVYRCTGLGLELVYILYFIERGSVLYLGMAMEILNLPYLCTTWIMTKEATNPKASMQRE